MPPPMVQGVELTKVHQLGDQQVHALDDVTLEVYAGELVAVAGKPGSGKSTLLHILGCLQRPDSGVVRLEGLDVTQLDEEELAQVRIDKVGFGFQAFNLLPDETALGNVEVPLRHQGMGAWDRREKAEKALHVVGLGTRLDRKPGQLSAVQRQFLSIARALVQDPAVIFADEPTGVLDSTSREEVLGLLQKLNEQGGTIVVATTESGVASYCQRIIRISEGRTVDEGPVSNQRIIPSSRRPGPASEPGGREVVVCPRCSYGNFGDAALCTRCEWPLHLTKDEERSIETRLSGTDSRMLGVESSSEEGDVPGGELVEELAKVPFFAGLGPKSLVKVIGNMEQQDFEKGSTIVKQGDTADSFFSIRAGNVGVYLERGGKPSIRVANLGPREGFGEMALLTEQPRSATVVATTDVETWCLSKASLDTLLSENLSLALYFNPLLSERLRTLQEKIVT